MTLLKMDQWVQQSEGASIWCAFHFIVISNEISVCPNFFYYAKNQMQICRLETAVLLRNYYWNGVTLSEDNMI